jgi:CRP-like cAMP-binding protein
MDVYNTLRKHRFFRSLTREQIRELADITQEETYKSGSVLFKEGEPAEGLYLLLEGVIQLYFSVEMEHLPGRGKELMFKEVRPGELVGISALINPYTLTSTARTPEPCRVLKIDASTLLRWCQEDSDFAQGFDQTIAEAAMQRLRATRQQLAAAYVR